VLSAGSAAPRRAELGRACPDSHLSWRPPAMGVLSEIDSRAPCYPAFSQAIWLRTCRRDGVNCGRPIASLAASVEQIVSHGYRQARWRQPRRAPSWDRLASHEPYVRQSPGSAIGLAAGGQCARQWSAPGLAPDSWRRDLKSAVLPGQVGCRVRPVVRGSVWLRPVE
jgi:hypothetical protein